MSPTTMELERLLCTWRPEDAETPPHESPVERPRSASQALLLSLVRNATSATAYLKGPDARFGASWRGPLLAARIGHVVESGTLLQVDASRAQAPDEGKVWRCYEIFHKRENSRLTKCVLCIMSSGRGNRTVGRPRTPRCGRGCKRTTAVRSSKAWG